MKREMCFSKDQVVDIVSRYLNIKLEEVASPCRKREKVYARQLFMYFLYKYSRLSLIGIGEIFGGRDHSTVVYSRDQISNLSTTDKSIKRDVLRIGRMFDNLVQYSISSLPELLDEFDTAKDSITELKLYAKEIEIHIQNAVRRLETLNCEIEVLEKRKDRIQEFSDRIYQSAELMEVA